MQHTHAEAVRRVESSPVRVGRRLAPVLVSAIIATVAGAGVASLVSSQRADASAPWNCTTAASLFTVTEGNTTVRSIDTTSGQTVMVREIPGRAIGGVSHNPTNGFVYGWDQNDRVLVRMNAGLEITPVPTPTALTSLAGQFFTIFAFDAAGQLWMTTTNPNQSVARPWYVVDLLEGSATYGELVRSGTWAPPAGHYVTPDFTYTGAGLLGISAAIDSPETPPRLYGIDAATGATVDQGPILGLTSHAQFGATWLGADGRLHAARNSGEIWAVNLITREAELLSEDATLATNNADGTDCGAVSDPPTTPVTPDPVSPDPVAPNPTTSPEPPGSSASPSEGPAGPDTSLSPTPDAPPSNPVLPGQAPAVPPLSPAEALAPTRSALTLQVTEHARGRRQGDRSTWVLTVTNPGNTVVRNPVVALGEGERSKDLSCALPATLAPGASGTCVTSAELPGAEAALQARAATGASTLITSAPVALRAATRDQPRLTAAATSRRTGEEVEVTVTVRNAGVGAVRDVALLPISVGDRPAPFVATCDANAALLLPGESTRCTLRLPVQLFDAKTEDAASTVNAQFRARGVPVGWATPIQSDVVRHTLALEGKR